MKNKILAVFLSLILMFSLSSVYATIEEIVGSGDPVPFGNKFANNALGAFQWAGYAISVGMIIFIGINLT